MKPPETWTEHDLDQLILQKQEENIELEFKSADALQQNDSRKAEISKDVSAFANSAGGTLIYGIKEDPEEPHPAVGLSPIDPSEVSKEWLEQVINSRIHPRIQGILINPVELKTAIPGKYAYVVVVPESTTAHQASDKRYYKRFNFQSVAMEDYEIRQTMGRTSRPGYEIQLSLTSSGTNQFRLNGTLDNQSEIVGHDVSVVLLIPKHLVVQPDDYEEKLDGHVYTRIVGGYVESSASTKSVIPSVPPLTPHVFNFRRHIQLPSEPIDGGKVRVVLRVFDQFGLSLTANLALTWPNYRPILESEVHASKTSRSYGHPLLSA